MKYKMIVLDLDGILLNDNNDIELLINSGLGICMKNGSKLCRQIALKISKYDNNNFGVAYELSKIFL